jgi:membrane dipeptidase
MKPILSLLGMLVLVLLPNAKGRADESIDPKLWQQALKIHRAAVVVDTHYDTPMLMLESGLDVGHRTDRSEVDFIRMSEGGVGAAFFAAFSPNGSDLKNPARKVLEMIDEVYRQVERYPDLAAMAFSADGIVDIHRQGKLAVLLGIENGGAIEGSLRLLRDFQRLGVRYVTLTHNANNDICDSATAEKPRWNGLSPFGRDVVREMNRLGMIIDVSHISDASFFAVLESSRAPVMASHSCARALCPVPRNMTDEMIRALAKKGGVIQINFYSSFLDFDYSKKAEAVDRTLKPEMARLKETYKDDRVKYMAAAIDLWKQNAPPPPPIDALIDHIDHVVKLVGADAVGLGSDFDGAGGYPQGLDDVTGYPLITYRLLKKGYSAEDIRKILGGNFLRLFREVARSGSGG